MINSSITGIVLAGGKSSRIGSDKGFLMLDGKCFMEHIINSLKPLVSDILIVSDNPNYDVFGHKRIEDVIKDSGPVAGIYSGLCASETAYNLVLSCDVPLIKTEILVKLIEAIDDTSEVIQVESNNRMMPLIALYKKATTDVFKNALDNDERRLQIVLNLLKTKNILLESHEIYTTINVNTPNELKIIVDGNYH